MNSSKQKSPNPAGTEFGGGDDLAASARGSAAVPALFVLARRDLGNPIPARVDDQGKLLHTLGGSCSPKAGTPPGTKVQLPW